MLSDDRAVCEPVAMLSRSSGSGVQKWLHERERCTRDQNADQFLSLKRWAKTGHEKCKMGTQQSLITTGLVSGYVQGVIHLGYPKTACKNIYFFSCIIAFTIKLEKSHVNNYRFDILSSPPLSKCVWV